jgi:hypothetical protein
LLWIRGRARAALTGALTAALTPPLLGLVILVVSLGLLEALPGLVLWALALGTTAVAGLLAQRVGLLLGAPEPPRGNVVILILWLVAVAEAGVIARLILR